MSFEDDVREEVRFVPQGDLALIILIKTGAAPPGPPRGTVSA